MGGSAETIVRRTWRLGQLAGLLRERILVIDGAMGTMLQGYPLLRVRLPGCRDSPTGRAT
jgi:methionine synthase I (cobalamin-dependent)